MLSNKFGAIAGAAMLGTAALLGTNAAYAVINLSAEAAMKVDPMVTYAKETLKAKVDDDSRYYVIDGGDDALHVTAKLGLAGGGDTDDDLIIAVELDGMVFTADSLDGAALSVRDGTAVSESAGGDKGDTSAIFAAKRGDGNDKDTVVMLQIEKLGITSDGPGGITMTITNVQQRQLLTGIVDNPGANIASYPGAIAVDGGIKETPTPKSPTALVSDAFKSFGMKNGPAPANADARDLVETVGSFKIELSAMDLLSAVDGGTVANVDTLVNIGSDDGDVADGASSVTFTGDFSFAAMVWLDAAESCARTNSDFTDDLLKRDPDDATMVTDTGALTPQTPATVRENANLCIMVPASTEEMPVSIPATGRYAAVTKYKTVLQDAAFPPSGGTHELGMIVRDGTTVRLPYLTTNVKFRQRVRIVNRGPAAGYYMEFHGEDDMAGARAEGTLAANSIMNMNLGTEDVVTPGNGNNTSGTLIVEAGEGMIDVATVQINRELGTTDTVVYTAD